MILLDTHIWVWWIEGNPKLKAPIRDFIDDEPELAISDISLWEVANKVGRGTMTLSKDLAEWMNIATSVAGVTILPITTEIAIGSANLPGIFHKDPADRLIVATARFYGVQLATQDAQILTYGYVQTLVL